MNYTQQFNQEFDRIYKLIHKDRSLECFCEEDLFSKIKTLHYIFTTKNKKGEAILKQADLPNPKYEEYNDRYNTTAEEMFLVDSFIPKTLADLFIENCIPRNNQTKDKIKIKNLKLINW